MRHPRSRDGVLDGGRGVSAFAALALYPLWAVSVLVGATAFRLGRARPLGLVALCVVHAIWVTGLVLLEHPDTAALAERVLPAGMLLGGAFVHAGADLTATPHRALVAAGYGWGAVVALVGAVAPRLLMSEGLSGPGPLFWPVAVPSALGVVAVGVWLLRSARSAAPRARRRIHVLTAGCVFGSLGGGGAMLAHLLGLADVKIAAPLLLPGILLTTWATLDAETGPRRRLVVQGLVYATITAAISAVMLAVFFLMLPDLTPGGGASIAWLLVVTFFAALPLDPVRAHVVEGVGRRFLRDPTGVPDLQDAIEQTEARAEHAEALADIGTMASAVAHEIRNPLGVISARAKLLERKGADPADVEALRGQVDRARRFLDDLLLYSRPRPLEVTEVDVDATIGRAIATVEARLPDPPPPIDVDCDPELVVEADADALHDALVVLVHNACAALHGRDEPHVWIRARGAPDAVEVTVDDDGPGVSEAIAPRLFRPFVSGRGRDARHPGTGLGLVIASRHASRHGGSLAHRSRPEGGASFVLRWPHRVSGGGRARSVDG